MLYSLKCDIRNNYARIKSWNSNSVIQLAPISNHYPSLSICTRARVFSEVRLPSLPSLPYFLPPSFLPSVGRRHRSFEEKFAFIFMSICTALNPLELFS